MKTRTDFMILIVAIAAVLLTACAKIENPAKMPHTNIEFGTMDYDGARAELEAAGFTNITAEKKDTEKETIDGKVVSVSVDGSTKYSRGSVFESNVPVVITYYVTTPKPTPEPEQSEATEHGFAPGDYTADAASLEKLAAELFAFEYSDLKVEWDDFDSAFVISYLPDTVLDETSYVYQNVNRYIHFCQYAYQIAGVERVRFDVMLAGVDQYGNDMVIEGISEIMTREAFEKFQWDNLAYTNIWESFSDNCYYFGYAPELVEKLDTTKVFYDSSTRDGKIT